MSGRLNKRLMRLELAAGVVKVRCTKVCVACTLKKCWDKSVPRAVSALSLCDGESHLITLEDIVAASWEIEPTPDTQKAWRASPVPPPIGEEEGS